MLAGIANFLSGCRRGLCFCRCGPEGSQQEKVPVQVPVDRVQNGWNRLGTSSRIKVFVNDPSDVSQWSDGSQWSPSNVPVSVASSRTASNGSVSAIRVAPPRRVPSTPDLGTSHLPADRWMVTQSSNQTDHLSLLKLDTRTPIVRQDSLAQHAPPVADLVQADKVALTFSSNVINGSDMTRDGPSCPAGQEVFTMQTVPSNMTALEKDKDEQAARLQGPDSRRHSKTSQGDVADSQGLTVRDDRAIQPSCSLVDDQDHTVATSPMCEPPTMAQTPCAGRGKPLKDADEINHAQRWPNYRERLPRRQKVDAISGVERVEDPVAQAIKETLPRKRAVTEEMMVYELQPTHIARERLPRKNVQGRIGGHFG
ncbi:hypothetical protein JVU11DRAFT_8718 [Chiua virens]|nr:hypothetical protein JVU11DRAFT_8718 [Chiua virens]